MGPSSGRSGGARALIGGLGRAMVGLGVLVLLFVAYELWGTGIAEARHQHDLRRQFAQSLRAGAGSPPSSAATPSSPSTPSATHGGPTPTPTPTPTSAAQGPPLGYAVALIRIPKIGVDKAVVEGVGVADLKKGPGHYPGTPLPGGPGNAAIAGHRTTYGAPFGRLDELARGDAVIVRTRSGTFRYLVDHSMTVRPSEVSVLDPTPDNRLTLTTCTPRFSAARRLVVVARLAGVASAPVPARAGTGAAGPGIPVPGSAGAAAGAAAGPLAGPLAGLSGGVAPRG
ncbi:MAG: class E sortase, partial [Acidimicrobiales bacterium]